jgi:hypothetical protein
MRRRINNDKIHLTLKILSNNRYSLLRKYFNKMALDGLSGLGRWASNQIIRKREET